MLLGYLPTWAVYMSVYDASKDFLYEHIGGFCLDASKLCAEAC
jgi:solute carrier family 25 folate transporter 32